MKRGIKRLLVLSLCICMVMGQTVFAQNEAIDTQGNTELNEAEEETEQTSESTPFESETTIQVEGVEINATNFPDAVFRDYISNQFDTDGNGSLSENEINSVLEIDVHSKNISTLEGIEHFTAMTTLNCTQNSLQSLDVSKNTELTILSCTDNQITNLDVSKNIQLVQLGCSDNPLGDLDISKNTSLVYLVCANNQLTTLDVSKNTDLFFLSCGGNPLTSLDITGNTKLQTLLIQDNQLVVLDISKNIELVNLHCDINQLTSLDVSKNTKLSVLTCRDNQLTSLDVSKNTELTSLDCANNQLTHLDVSKNTGLTSLGCDNNQLTSLDVSKNTELTSLYCEDNQLINLDVRSCTKLERLYVRPLTKAEVQYAQEPAEFCYNTAADSDTSGITTNTNSSEVKADIAGMDLAQIYTTFNISFPNSNAKVVIAQKDTSKKDKEYLTNIANQSGNTVLKVYDVVMNLYENGEHKGMVTDNFGNLKLTFYVGTEYAGRKVTIYQLHGDEIVLHKDKNIEKDGTVTLTVSQLSSFAIALQDTANTNNTIAYNIRKPSPQTGDSAAITFWSILFILAMSAFVMGTVKRKKDRY